MKYDISNILSVDQVIKCTSEDIDNHYNIVQPLVKTVDKTKYKERMLQAVTENSAFKLKDDSCFLYYLKTDKYAAEGVCFYGKNNPKGMLTLFSCTFTFIDKLTTIFRFLPITGKEINSYKSLLLPGSIKNWRRSGKPVVIRVDLLKKKINLLLSRYK